MACVCRSAQTGKSNSSPAKSRFCLNTDFIINMENKRLNVLHQSIIRIIQEKLWSCDSCNYYSIKKINSRRKTTKIYKERFISRPWRLFASKSTLNFCCTAQQLIRTQKRKKVIYPLLICLQRNVKVIYVNLAIAKFLFNSF